MILSAGEKRIMVHFKHNLTKQTGIGLVEVLIALLVFSLGMLGVASLQVVATKSSFEAQQRQEAVLLARDIIARMKSSGLSFDDIKTKYGSMEFSEALPAPTPACKEATDNCSPILMAIWDKYEWSKSIAAAAVGYGGTGQGLLKAKGCVTYGDKLITVTIAWESMTEMGAGGGGDCDIAGAGKKQRHVEVKTYISYI